MTDLLAERAVETAEYIIETGCTVRQAAAHFGVSKSTVHKDVSRRLRGIDRALYDKVEAVLQLNKAERHIRGGMATKRKFEIMREKDRGGRLRTRNS